MHNTWWCVLYLMKLHVLFTNVISYRYLTDILQISRQIFTLENITTSVWAVCITYQYFWYWWSLLILQPELQPLNNGKLNQHLILRMVYEFPRSLYIYNTQLRQNLAGWNDPMKCSTYIVFIRQLNKACDSLLINYVNW